ncbi:hypothetical protein PRIPAC_75759, partial [Pristionchus pacificus]|uniref:Uncharacterized protein n=1 Tax=Pristionchus pacificus TaxID=54126 RepID=A0A2A6C875_PRIPA
MIGRDTKTSTVALRAALNALGQIIGDHKSELQRSSVEIRSVELGDGVLCALLVGELAEAEALRTTQGITDDEGSMEQNRSTSSNWSLFTNYPGSPDFDPEQPGPSKAPEKETKKKKEQRKTLKLKAKGPNNDDISDDVT